MSNLKQEIARRVHEAAAALERALDRSREKLGLQPGVEDVEHIAAYTGYATIDKVTVTGRLLANPPPPKSEEDHGWWDNLGSLWRRACSNEVIGAEVVLSYADVEQTVVTCAEGYYEATFDRVDSSLDADLEGIWTRVRAQVPGAATKVRAEHAVVVPPAGACFGVISDMDDTVIHTGATQRLLMARRMLFGNARLRQPLAGVAAFYHALQRDGDGGDLASLPLNPIFYVSSSPWNLYELLEEFLRHHDIPTGPLLLRDYGIDETKLVAEKGHRHKFDKAERIMAAYPDLPFVLIGDSSQDDAEIYAELAQRHADRILAVYIRDVDPDEDTARDARVDGFIESISANGVPMMRARDSLAMAEHAAEIGLIASDSVALVAADVRRDGEMPATVDEAIEEVAAEKARE